MRIGIVNDLGMAIELLRRLVTRSKRHEILWVATNGVEAVQKCKENTPDLILMDLVMPVMDGSEATRLIMQSTPCAILIVTASVEGNLELVFQAMGHGALDVVCTPSLNPESREDGGELLLKKIDMISVLVKPCKTKMSAATDCYELPPLLVMGASTGGPNALAKILSDFPGEVPFATVIIQHVDQEFAPGFARWIADQTAVPVTLIKQGMQLQQGIVYIADKNTHLVATKGGCLRYLHQDEQMSYCPSVDIFFKSVADNWHKPGVAALLTGMGEDGAKGLKCLKESNWYTIAEHENSCVVFGMPKVAISMDAVCKVVELEDIAGVILHKFGCRKTAGSRK